MGFSSQIDEMRDFRPGYRVVSRMTVSKIFNYSLLRFCLCRVLVGTFCNIHHFPNIWFTRPFFSTNTLCVSQKLKLFSPFVAFTWKEFQRLDELSSCMSSIHQRAEKKRTCDSCASTSSIRNSEEKNAHIKRRQHTRTQTAQLSVCEL